MDSDSNLRVIPSEAFNDILQELERKPLSVNKYRNKAGEGRSQAYGLVNRRSVPIDYSRQNWIRPKLYYHLVKFAEKYVDISYTSITVNQNYQAMKHRDKGNEGVSYLVAFGNYTGGDLKIWEGDLSGNHNIRHRPIVAEFNKIYHSVEPFQGNRYSLVFYSLKKDKIPQDLPTQQVIFEDGKYFFKRGDKIMKATDHNSNHPLAKGNSGYMKVHGKVEVSFD